MSWHYQATHRVDHGEDVYEVHEVYEGLNDDGSDAYAYTENAVTPSGETIDELVESLKMMSDDCTRWPVLEVEP